MHRGWCALLCGCLLCCWCCGGVGNLGKKSRAWVGRERCVLLLFWVPVSFLLEPVGVLAQTKERGAKQVGASLTPYLHSTQNVCANKCRGIIGPEVWWM